MNKFYKLLNKIRFKRTVGLGKSDNPIFAKAVSRKNEQYLLINGKIAQKGIRAVFGALDNDQPKTMTDDKVIVQLKGANEYVVYDKQGKLYSKDKISLIEGENNLTFKAEKLKNTEIIKVKDMKEGTSFLIFPEEHVVTENMTSLTRYDANLYRFISSRTTLNGELACYYIDAKANRISPEFTNETSLDEIEPGLKVLTLFDGNKAGRLGEKAPAYKVLCDGEYNMLSAQYTDFEIVNNNILVHNERGRVQGSKFIGKNGKARTKYFFNYLTLSNGQIITFYHSPSGKIYSDIQNFDNFKYVAKELEQVCFFEKLCLGFGSQNETNFVFGYDTTKFYKVDGTVSKFIRNVLTEWESDEATVNYVQANEKVSLKALNVVRNVLENNLKELPTNRSIKSLLGVSERSLERIFFGKLRSIYAQKAKVSRETLENIGNEIDSILTEMARMRNEIEFLRKEENSTTKELLNTKAIKTKFENKIKELKKLETENQNTLQEIPAQKEQLQAEFVQISTKEENNENSLEEESQDKTQMGEDE